MDEYRNERTSLERFLQLQDKIAEQRLSTRPDIGAIQGYRTRTIYRDFEESKSPIALIDIRGQCSGLRDSGEEL